MIVLARDMKGGELITPEKLNIVETAEKGQPGKPVSDDFDCTNVKMAYSVAAGSVLTEVMLFHFRYLRLAVNSVGQAGRGSAIAKGKNDEAIMEENIDGTFTLTTGRIGVRVGPDKPRHKTLPMNEWEETVEAFEKRGYRVVTEEKHEKKKLSGNSEYRSTGDESVDDVLNILMTAANEAVQENITVTVEDISTNQLETAQGILTKLNRNQDISPAAFNAKLHDLYIAIPRNIVNPKKMEVHRQKEFEQKIADEQEFLDFLINQVKLAQNGSRLTAQMTIPEKYGMDWRPVLDDEEAMIRKMMRKNASQYSRAWRVINKKTEAAFEEYCESHGISEKKGISHLFHGSGTENFFLSLQTACT